MCFIFSFFSFDEIKAALKLPKIRLGITTWMSVWTVFSKSEETYYSFCYMMLILDMLVVEKMLAFVPFLWTSHKNPIITFIPHEINFMYSFEEVVELYC